MENFSINFSTRVSNILLNHIKPSTKNLYAAKWSRFCFWLQPTCTAPVTAGLSHVFEFLLSLRDSGLSHSSLRVYLSALSAFHSKVDSFTLFSHPLSKKFLRGLFWVYPQVKLQPTPWDLRLILWCLTRHLFEPAAMSDLRLFSWKVLFLTVITSARRVGESAALDIRTSFLAFLPHSVRLSTNLTFLPKVVSEFHINSVIDLPDFFPNPTSLLETLYHAVDVKILFA